MRALKVLGLLAVAALAALLSGGPAGAGATTAAVAAVAADVVEQRFGGPVAAPVVAAPATTTPTTRAIPSSAAPTTTASTGTRSASTSTPQAPARSAAAEEPARASARGTPCRATARACVDLSANQAWLISDGEASYGPVPITHGRKGFRTPPGTFAVSFKNRDHVSSIYDAPMPYSVFFNGGIAFHQGSLSERSHGCIHLSRTAAKRFFGTLDTGDTVQVVR